MKTLPILSFKAFCENFKAGLILIVLLTCSQSVYAQSALKTFMNQQASDDVNLPSYIQKADSIVLADTLGPIDSASIKKYYRWRRDAYPRSTFYGATPSSNIEDLKTYLSSIPSFCHSGPVDHEWEAVGPNPTSANYQEAGLVNAIAADPVDIDIIYAGTYESGIWKTTDGGQNWANITDTIDVVSLGISCINVDPSDGNRIIAGTITHSLQRPYGNWLGYNGIGTIYSTNGGESWGISTFYDAVGVPLSITSGHIVEITRSPENSEVIIAVGYRSIFRSSDGGVTFHEVYSMTPTEVKPNGNKIYGTFFADVEFNLADPSTVIATCRMAQANALTDQSTELEWAFVSSDTGKAWSESVIPNTNLEHPVNPGLWHPSVVYADVTNAESSSFYLIFCLKSDWPLNPKNFIYSTTDGVNYDLVHLDSSWIPGGNANAGTWLRVGFQVSDIDTSIRYVSGNYFCRINSNIGWTEKSTFYPRDAVTPQSSFHGDVRDIEIIGTANGKDIVLVANDGGISISYDGADTWNNLNGNGLIITQFFGFDKLPNNENYIGGAVHNGTYRINESDWRGFVDGGDGEFAEYPPHLDNFEMFMLWSGSTFFKWYVDGQLKGTHYVPSAPLGRRFSIDPVWQGEDGLGKPLSRLYYCGYDLFEIEFGESWVNRTMLFNRANYPGLSALNAPISIARFAGSDNTVGYLAFEGFTENDPNKRMKLWKTTDRGTTWLNINGNFTIDGGSTYVSRNSYVSDILIHPNDANTVFVSMVAYHKDPATGMGRQRVLYTTDGGNTWHDFSNDLPAVPANTLAIDGTSMLYVGTDAGIYYTDISTLDPVNHQWHCFNKDLPNSMVEQLRIDPCTREIAAAVRGRGIWKAPLVDAPYSSIEITGTKVWDGSRVIESDLIIKSGANLTLTGDLWMANGRVIVEAGGVFTIDGGKVDSHCGGYWSGIYVSGDINSYPQIASEQGTLNVINGGTITNARDAVTNIGVDQNGNWIYGTQGGILNLSGAIFKNNRRDIQMLRYPHVGQPYQATIENCQFIKDNNFPIEIMLSSISMWEVYGVELIDCVFKNENTGDFAHDGGGLYTINTLFKVGNGLQGGCTFEGFGEAIRSENYSLPLTRNGEIEIVNNDFTDNIHSVYISGATMSSVIGNRIDVPNPALIYVPNPRDQPLPYGIYMDMCPTFDVRQNFLKTDGPKGAIATVGIVVNNAGGNNNNIYKNEIDGFTIGMESIGDNRNTGASAANDGLFYRCNTLGATTQWSTAYGNTEDIYVGAEVLTSNSGIALNQGYDQINSNTLPNNLFKNSGLQYQIENKVGQTQNYYFEESAPFVEPSSVFDVNKIQVSDPAFNWNNYCMDLPEVESMSAATLLSDINSFESDLNSDLSLRDELLNGGNTPALEAAILFAENQEDYQNLYIDLMEMSPYVDDQILMDLIQIEDYPELALRNIMVANPHGARNPEIWDMLISRYPPLSQQTLDDIEQEQQTITTFDVLQMSIGHTRADLEYNKNSLIRKYLSSFEENETALMSFLSSEDDPTYLYLLTEAHIANGNTTSASSVLNSIPTACSLNEKEAEEYNDLSTLYSLLINAGEMQLNELGSTQIATLHDIVTGGYGAAVGKANALLKLNGEETGYVEPILLPSGGSGKTSSSASHVVNRPATVQFDVRIYPNPAKDMARIEWNPAEFVNIEELTVQVSSMEGRIILNAKIEDIQQSFYPLDLSSLTPGAYIVSLGSEIGEVFSTKLVVE